MDTSESKRTRPAYFSAPQDLQDRPHHVSPELTARATTNDDGKPVPQESSANLDNMIGINNQKVRLL